MAQRWSHGPVGAVVAAWPAVSLVGSYELLVWLIRTSGAADRGPLAGHLCTGAACRAAARSVPASAVEGERPAGNQRGTSGTAWRPAGQAAGLLPLAAKVYRGASTVKCETYPIEVSGSGGAVPNHAEPWPLPMKPAADRFVYPGSGQPMRAEDHIRLRGQLFIENGHPENGSPWIELHPFDYTRITKLGDTISSGDFTLVAPLYSRATYVKHGVIQPTTWSGVVLGETFAPDIPVAFAGHQPVTLQLTHPVLASGPALTYTERILENTTGQPADSIRHIQFDPATGVLVVTGSLVTDDDLTAPLFNQRRAFRARYIIGQRPEEAPAQADRLTAKEGLAVGGSLRSPNGFVLALQGDGNLVVYTQHELPLWASNTAGHTDVWYLQMEPGGNLVLHDQNDLAMWASGTDGHPGAWAVMQGDGNFVIYDAANKPLWATNTVVVDVPNVIGQSPDAASATLQAAGLQRQIVEVRQGGERPTVIGQSPMANTLVAPGTTVDLTVEDPKHGPQP